MCKANKFDMISRTVGERLPDCDVYTDYDPEIDGYRLEFYGEEHTISSMPSLLDIALEGHMLASSALLKNICKNGKGYIAEYHAYALHVFNETIPN